MIIWLGGPGRNNSLYNKRVIIKEILKEDGFDVIFSEDFKAGTDLVYKEEEETVILQRRCLRAAKDLSKGSEISEDMVDTLRPSSKDGLHPKYKQIIIGRKVKEDFKKGDPFTWKKI